MDPRSRPGARALGKCTSLLSPGAPRVAVDRDWRDGGEASRKPGHPSLSRAAAGRSAALGHSDPTMRLRGLILGLARKSGQVGPCPTPGVWV